MILAISPQRLSPPIDLFAPVCERIRDHDRLARRRFKQSKRSTEFGGRPFQFRVELGQPGVLSNQVHEDLQRVAQTSEDLWINQLLVGLFPQAGTERQQMARKVATVHRRYIKRQERLERAGLIPVIEVAAIPFEALHRGEAFLRASKHAPDRKISEIPGRKVGQQRKPKVCGGGARSDDGRGDLLEIIRRQPVLPRVDERLEKEPGLASCASEKAQLFGGQIRRCGFNGLADPPCDPGRRQPEGEEREGHGELRGRQRNQQESADQANDRCDEHCRVKSGKICARFAF